MILRKLGHYSKKNKLYKAFQELGRVIRTVFLLKYISIPELQKIITATDNKCESYNGFSQQLMFANFGVIQSNNPVEQEKRIKYTDLIANAVMLQNVIDLSKIINELATEGVSLSKEVLSILSPYILHSIKRYGIYLLNSSIKPPQIIDIICNIKGL